MDTAANQPVDRVEGRKERRMRTLKGAQIVFNGGRSVFDCTVRNLSPSGAMLEIPSMLGIPPKFEIVMEHATARRPCTVRWHTDRLIGVHFDDAPAAAA